MSLLKWFLYRQITNFCKNCSQNNDSLINPKNNCYHLFKHRFEKTLEMLKSIPINEKSDEAIVPVYIHNNFFVRKIFADRFNAPYKMTSFKDKIVLDYGY